MSTADTPAPAAPLDGPREQFEKLLTAFERAVFQNGKVQGKDDLSAYHEDDEADALGPKEALRLFVSGLLADAALLDRTEKWVRQRDADGVLDVCIDSGTFYVTLTGLQGGDGATLREALSGAMDFAERGAPHEQSAPRLVCPAKGFDRLRPEAQDELRDYAAWLGIPKPRPEFHTWRLTKAARALPEGGA